MVLQRERINSNLIDLNSPTATNVEHDYVNEKLGHIDSADNTSTSTTTAVSTSSNSIFRDVFDMREYYRERGKGNCGGGFNLIVLLSIIVVAYPQLL